MRKIINLNTKWAFAKHVDTVPETMPERWCWVNLPHTWNGIDGQDGNNDLYQAYYHEELIKIEMK